MEKTKYYKPDDCDYEEVLTYDLKESFSNTEADSILLSDKKFITKEYSIDDEIKELKYKINQQLK
jgi:hypothetical protein